MLSSSRARPSCAVSGTLIRANVAMRATVALSSGIRAKLLHTHPDRRGMLVRHQERATIGRKKPKLTLAGASCNPVDLRKPIAILMVGYSRRSLLLARRTGIQ
jgi:hypothetical protein